MSKAASTAAAAAKMTRGGMIKLSPSVYYIPSTHTPSLPATPSLSSASSESGASTPSAPSTSSLPAAAAARGTEPGLILLGTWMGAHMKNIVKYTEVYRRLFPDSPILLLRAEASHFLKPRGARDLLAPAVEIVEAYAADARAGLPDFSGPEELDGVLARLREARAGEKGGEQGEQGERKAKPMLVQLWSNGGSNSFASLRALARAFPPYTLLIDSAPGQFHFRSTFTAFSLTIPQPWLRRLLAPLIYAMCVYFWVRVRVRRLTGGGPGPLQITADSHNSPALLGKEIRRAYIYSEEDALVPWTDVEEHARAARKNGFDVRLEKFRGAHVAHAREDPQRYWAIAKETWYGPGAAPAKDRAARAAIAASAEARA